jgi:hypothetical protein
MAKQKSEEIVLTDSEALNEKPTVVTENVKVRIRVLKDVDCTIHTEAYLFKAGADAMVPPMVACILINGGKATKI